MCVSRADPSRRAWQWRRTPPVFGAQGFDRLLGSEAEIVDAKPHHLAAERLESSAEEQQIEWYRECLCAHAHVVALTKRNEVRPW
jgi:hypothetical protein